MLGGSDTAPAAGLTRQALPGWARFEHDSCTVRAGGPFEAPWKALSCGRKCDTRVTNQPPGRAGHQARPARGHARHARVTRRDWAKVAAKLANMPAHRPPGKSANLHTSQSRAAELLNVGTRKVRAVWRTARPENCPVLSGGVQICERLRARVIGLSGNPIF